MPYTANQARSKLKADRASPADYGISSWDQANYQTLANAIGDIVVKSDYFNRGISDAVKANRILAHPGGSTDPVTNRKLTEEQTQQAVASYTKEDAIAEIRKQAESYYDSVYYQSANYTPKGKELAKQTADAAVKTLYDKVKNYISPSEFDSIFGKQVADRQKFLYDAALRNAKEDARGGFLGFLDKATPVVANIGAGIISGGLTLPQQLAVSAAVGVTQGANTSDIVRNIVGTLAAAQIGSGSNISGVKEFNEAVAAINSPELQSAIFNAARQGVYATVTEQDIAKNMAAGAVAGAIATNIQGKYKDPALSNAVGEFIQAKIAGKSDFDAIASALGGYATEEQRANAKKVIAKEISGLPLDQVQALGYKTQDEITGSLFPEEKKLPSIEVVGQRDPQDLDGLNLINRVRTGREAQEGLKKLPPIEVVAQREEEEISEPQRLITEEQDQTRQQEEPELQRVINRPVLLGLLGGGVSGITQGQRTQRTPNEREAASMQALTQALSVGDPGEALFGGGLGRRRNVWNVESLRLKDELGG